MVSIWQGRSKSRKSILSCGAGGLAAAGENGAVSLAFSGVGASLTLDAGGSTAIAGTGSIAAPKLKLAAGLNFRFIGTQSLVIERTDSFPALFTVYRPLSGPPVFTGSQKVYGLV